MDNSLVDSFSKNQKLSSVTLIRLISSGCEDKLKIKLQEEVIKKQAVFLGLNFSECESFLNNLNPLDLPKEFKSFNNIQKDFLVSMAYEILFCGGMPSDREYIIGENVFRNIANIGNDDFLKRIEKIQALGNFFS